MMMQDDQSQSVPVIPLASAPGERTAWNRGRHVVYGWAICELLLVTNPWQISSRLRVAVLRRFGAEIGPGVTFRPRTRVKFPWKLHIGRDSWIGEGVWFHNQDDIFVGHDVVISQETMLTTGTHAHRRDMALLTKPIVISDGVWLTSRCMVLGGVTIGTSSVISPMTVVDRDIPENSVVGRSGSPTILGPRFRTRKPSGEPE